MEVTNPDRLVFPVAGITKGEVVEHYVRVGTRMIELCGGRPLTLERYPRGIAGAGFMQKNAGRHFPDTIRRHPVPKRDGGVTAYPVVDRPGDLAWLANQGTVTFHMWAATADASDQVDWMILDLDPTEGDTDGARLGVRTVGEVLDAFGLHGTPVATGSTGFHVWVPLAPGPATVSQTARAVAGLAALRHPDRLTTEFLKRERGGRVFLDWLRTRPGATTAVPFSLRARPAAPVAVPLTWDEVADARPDTWTLRKLGDRLEVPLPWRAQQLPAADIEAAARVAGVDLDTPFDRFGRT